MNHFLYRSIIFILYVSESLQYQEVSNDQNKQNLRSIQSIHGNKIRIESNDWDYGGGGKGKKKKGKKKAKGKGSKKHKKASYKDKKKKFKGKGKGKNKNKNKKIPKKCTIDDSLIVNKYNDGTCDQRLNNWECRYDGGDCYEFNRDYPNCKVDNPEFVGDEFCDGILYNTTECGYDGGDCLPKPNFGCSGAMNGYCENMYNTMECDWDGGDCLEFNEKYPDCKVPEPSFVGDGLCDTIPYLSEECGWDGGDCEDFPVNCKVSDTYAIGDGVCNIEFNTTDCEYDGGDCLP